MLMKAAAEGAVVLVAAVASNAALLVGTALVVYSCLDGRCFLRWGDMMSM